MDFEKCSKELEGIIERLSDETLSLEEGTKLFERGVELSKLCNEQLDNAKGKITILKQKLDDATSEEK